MSFLSGFLIGQATTAKNGQGGAVGGFLLVVVLAAMIVVIGATLGALFLPLYSGIHLTIWAANTEAMGGVLMLLIPPMALIIIPAAYIMALFGRIEQACIGFGILGTLSLLSVLAAPFAEGSVLYDQEFVSDPRTIGQSAILTAGLTLLGSVGTYVLIGFAMGVERRDARYERLITPLRNLHQSVGLAWMGFLLGLFALGLGLFMVYGEYQEIYKFMAITGKSYDEGFQHVFYADTYQEMVSALTGFGLVFALMSLNLFVRLRRSADQAKQSTGSI